MIGENILKDKRWKYRIGARKAPVILTFIMFAAFGGLTAWLNSTNNGAFIFTGFFSAILLALVIATSHRLAFFKVLIGRDSFYYQTGSNNGKLYKYSEVEKAWINSGEAQNRSVQDYCNIEITDGPVIRFQFFDADERGIEYLIKRVEDSANKEQADRRSEKAEYTIDGKVFAKTRIVAGAVLLVLVTIISVVIIKATGHIYLALPGAVMVLIGLLSLVNRNLYYKIHIGETGFDYRTNPFNRKYFEYSEIVSCRKIKKVVYHRTHIGDADLPSYFFFFEFTDTSGKTRKFQFEDPIHGHEIDVLQKRIEKADKQ